MPISRRIVTASILLAAAAGLAFPVLIESASEPRLVSRVELGSSSGTATVAGDDARESPGKPVPVVPRGERGDDEARSNVEDDDERDDADDDADAEGDDGTGDTGRPAGAGDDTDAGGSSGD